MWVKLEWIDSMHDWTVPCPCCMCCLFQLRWVLAVSRRAIQLDAGPPSSQSWAAVSNLENNLKNILISGSSFPLCAFNSSLSASFLSSSSCDRYLRYLLYPPHRLEEDNVICRTSHKMHLWLSCFKNCSLCAVVKMFVLSFYGVSR